MLITHRVVVVRITRRDVQSWIVIFCFLLFTGCGASRQGLSGTGSKYEYEYRLSVPSDSQKTGLVDEANLLFHDDSLIVQFKIDDAAIHLQLQNLADSYLVVDWAKVRILHKGKNSKIRQSLGFYADSTKLPVSISLPPLGFVRDYVTPSENVYYDGSRWVERDLFPTWDTWTVEGVTAIRNQIGNSVVLTLPVWFGSFEKTYVFEFRITSFEPISLQHYSPPWRDPRPLNEKVTPALADQITTAAIIVGVVSFSIYMLVIKKETPADLR
ncbi:MAG: hypothetical protein HYY49_06735 [Ignavibacteriales bacterium]|nr:hypothetical protein [Ignavibacteriales bacterium]